MNNERGFTLIEALVATLVLTIGLLAMAELLAVSLRMHQLGRNSTIATRLAQDKFEEMMKMNFNTNPAIQVANCGNALASNVANCFDTPANSGYTRRWRVTAGPTVRLRTVTVRVIPTNTDRRIGADFTVTSLIRSW
jgi:type IV pilus modification protein PilV